LVIGFSCQRIFFLLPLSSTSGISLFYFRFNATGFFRLGFFLFRFDAGFFTSFILMSGFFELVFIFRFGGDFELGLSLGLTMMRFLDFLSFSFLSSGSTVTGSF
jgi:hypothetical protein